MLNGNGLYLCELNSESAWRRSENSIVTRVSLLSTKNPNDIIFRVLGRH